MIGKDDYVTEGLNRGWILRELGKPRLIRRMPWGPRKPVPDDGWASHRDGRYRSPTSSSAVVPLAVTHVDTAATAGTTTVPPALTSRYEPSSALTRARP